MRELRFVVRVLIAAAAARAKVAAGRHDALRRCDDESLRLRRLRSRASLHDAHARLLAGQCERHKYSLALDARQERAAIDRLFNLHDLFWDGAVIAGSCRRG